MNNFEYFESTQYNVYIDCFYVFVYFSPFYLYINQDSHILRIVKKIIKYEILLREKKKKKRGIFDNTDKVFILV